MAPAPVRKPIPKEKIRAAFEQAKIQTYYDPSARGPGLHTIRTIAWSPTGSFIATGSVDRTLRIWNPDKPNVKNSTELRGHTSAVERVAWNPTKDGELASVSHDGTARFWDVRSRVCHATVDIGGEGLTIAWAPDGKLVVVGRKDDVLVPISVPERAAPAPAPAAGTATATATAPAPAGAGGEYVVREHIPQNQQTNQIIFAPLLPGSTSYTLLLTTGSGTIKICRYPLNAGGVHGVKTSSAVTEDEELLPDAPGTSETSIVTSNNNNNNKPTESAGNPQPGSSGSGSSSELQLLHTLSSHTSSCFCLELSSTGRYLATGGSDALICLWDTSEWVCRRTLDKMAGAVRGLGFSWDGAYVVGSSDEGSGLEIAHAETGDYVFTVPTGMATPCVAWHPSRYWLAYSGDTGGLKIFGAAGGPV